MLFFTRAAIQKKHLQLVALELVCLSMKSGVGV